MITFADFRIRRPFWVCRWCRQRALTIDAIRHENDCGLLAREGVVVEEVEPARSPPLTPV